MVLYSILQVQISSSYIAQRHILKFDLIYDIIIMYNHMVKPMRFPLRECGLPSIMIDVQSRASTLLSKIAVIAFFSLF